MNNTQEHIAGSSPAPCWADRIISGVHLVRCSYCNEVIGGSLTPITCDSYAVYEMRRNHAIRDACRVDPMSPSYPWATVECPPNSVIPGHPPINPKESNATDHWADAKGADK